MFTITCYAEQTLPQFGVSTGYNYDNASRLSQVLSETNSASYTHLANSPLVSQIAFTNGGALRMTTTKQYDLLNRLTSITNLPSASSAIGFRYAYNNANQRTSVTNAESARWIYQYDSLGQVTSGRKYWGDGTPVAGQQFEYTFDDIGNRKTTAAGGDQFSVNLRSAGYTNNSLNQITSRGVPGYVDMQGSATNTATVTVNNQATYRKGDYFRAELTAANTSPLWFGVTNVAVLNNGTNADIVSSVTGNVFVAKSPEAFTYDADGNLTSDSLWTNTWNGENRLMSTESTAGVPTAGKRKVDYAYDYFGRMIQRIASTNNGTAYVAFETNRFIYDATVQLAELNGANSLQKSYVRGLDLSGTMQGAGGVGGLLMIGAGTNGTHLYCHDGNGNVMALVSATNGVSSAEYDYTPFGQLPRATGPMALINTFGFSGQYRDNVTRRILYLYRSYNPDTGTWESRDLIEEQGGMNLYGFVDNNAINKSDSLGLKSFPILKYLPIPMLGPSLDNELAKKYAYYKSIRLFFKTPHWTKMLDDWYDEIGDDPIKINGETDPRNKDIISNVGFDKMLRCLLKLMEDPKTPVVGLGAESSIDATKKQFNWHYALSRGQSPGGEAAYTDAMNFLGSYRATVEKLNGEFEVTVENTTGWTSATAIPTTGHDVSLWSDHDRYKGYGTRLGFKSHGGNWPQIYKFKVKACPGDCIFP
jgi:RHS repeat-associated protein